MSFKNKLHYTTEEEKRGKNIKDYYNKGKLIFL